MAPPGAPPPAPPPAPKRGHAARRIDTDASRSAPVDVGRPPPALSRPNAPASRREVGVESTTTVVITSSDTAATPVDARSARTTAIEDPTPAVPAPPALNAIGVLVETVRPSLSADTAGIVVRGLVGTWYNVQSAPVAEPASLSSRGVDIPLMPAYLAPLGSPWLAELLTPAAALAASQPFLALQQFAEEAGDCGHTVATTIMSLLRSPCVVATVVVVAAAEVYRRRVRRAACRAACPRAADVPDITYPRQLI